MANTAYANKYADERQAELHKKFSSEHFFSSEKNLEHFMLWVTFFRRNMHRFAMDYLGIRLHIYQIVLLYMMGICEFICVIASRASAKSFVIALYACCRCILYPGSSIVLSSSTKGQSKLLVSEKIQKELMSMSPNLRKEILGIKDNQNQVQVFFHNTSTITVVPASENGRGYRSNVIVREEFRMIKKEIDDSILSPFQIVRQPAYILDPYYSSIMELKEEPVDIYISSSWYDNGTSWMWSIVDQTYKDMLNGKPSCLLAFDESIALKHGIKTMKYFQTEKKKQDALTWLIEFYNCRLKENRAAFFSRDMLLQNQRCKQPFFPRTLLDFKTKRKNPYGIAKMPGEVRIVTADLAFVENNRNDNSIFTLMRLLPESTTHKVEGSDDVVIDNGYRRIVPYMESKQGGEIRKQAIRIRQLYTDFEADYICLDLRNAGRNAV